MSNLSRVSCVLSAAIGVGTLFSPAMVSEAVAGGGLLPVQTTHEDFFEPGTQPNEIIDPILDPEECFFCHALFDDPATTNKPFRWRGSMHAHAGRDPIFHAAVSIANQDAEGAAETCYRCHMPEAFLEGRGAADGSQLTDLDIDSGISCHVCHRLVDHDYEFGVSPLADELVLADIGIIPKTHGNAQMVVDPLDRRRGPYSYGADEPGGEFFFPPHAWIQSPHHQTAELCATCHDVSNPALSRVGGEIGSPSDTYVLNALGEEHPTLFSSDMFPEQRTYSEFLYSAFGAGGGVPADDDMDPYDLDGRFGGNIADGVIGSCQDCHMPERDGFACVQEVFDPPFRENLFDHGWVGANVFAIDLILELNPIEDPDDFSDPFNDDYTIPMLNRARAETIEMLQLASDMELSVDDSMLNVRVINQCGHKLLTGYPEGRRIWINVQYFDDMGELIDERGAYDFETATLDTASTKVYETKDGLDATMAAATGLPEGESFHLILNNTRYKDNRIPPRGYVKEIWDQNQLFHVGYEYADGQHWDDTAYDIPAGAASAEVTVYYQTSSREYIEFLRDANTSDTNGQILYDAWETVGKSMPIVMDNQVIDLDTLATMPGDADGNGIVDFNDLVAMLFQFGAPNPTPNADCDGSGVVDFNDLVCALFLFTETGA
ncbi:unnamed protein product [Symbiodinium necroappetens]|uniref:EF-hand domain-containing protein n=1 Tax=Symbiodinium necroappetens TaxID=1628268 RepID=A0A812W4W4_9DINO|nr:unnamed protein product [Symbiodinium necroappetens]